MIKIESFFHEPTSTLTYVVWDKTSRDAVVIDPVLDYDSFSSAVDTRSIDEIATYLREHDLRLHYVLETHAHADHLSGCQRLKKDFGAKVVIGERISEVQTTFKSIFDFPDDFPTDGRQFDRLVQGGEVLRAGRLSIRTIPTPGHTPACMTYHIEDALFTGDALFMDDYGTGRCDFPKGSADDLFHSIHEQLYRLPEETRVFVGHDYRPNGRELKFETTIGASKRNNPQLNAETTHDEFVAFRTKRDATLRAPRLLYQSVQVNINAGILPEPHANGMRYLLLPLSISKDET